MEKILKLIDRMGNWGTIAVDNRGKLIDASPDFCENFSINKDDWLGVSIDEIIGRTEGGKNKKVIFASIFGYACLIRISVSKNGKTYRIIVREEEIDHHEMLSFINMIDLAKVRKTPNRQNYYSFNDIIGKSPAIEQTKELAARMAASDSTVLLTGESGTGKELFAQAIHGLSKRREHPFVAVNCAAIPNDLFESEVFGYEGGAFSGAKKGGKPGKIEMAQHGTLFLDEIAELPYQAQGKLLRVLQEREVERLGGIESKNVDIRIIVATNKNLKTLVQDEKFRQDLFYRLYVFDLNIPPLRQRKEDILPLVYNFIGSFNERLGHDVQFIDSDLQEWLLNYDWPGNVRELKATIERGMNMVEGDTLTIDRRSVLPSYDDGEPVGTDPPLLSLKEEVEKAEIGAIRRALHEAKGDRTLAARKLNIHLASLYRKMAKYNLKNDD